MRLILLALLFAGCASFPKRDPAKLIFPLGRYRHDTHVTVRMEPAMDLTLQSVVETGPDRVRVVALSPMQTTLFTIVDTRGDVQLTIYDDALKKREREIRHVYPLLREVLYAERPAHEITRAGARITIEEDRILVEHPRFRAVTKVVKL